MRVRALAVAALLAGCTDAAPYHGLPVAQEKVEQFDVIANRPQAIDVLFVVDRSPALAGYRDLLHAQLASAGAQLAFRRHHDLHLGVVGAAADDGPGAFIPEITNARGERVGFAGDLAAALPAMVLLAPRAEGDTHLFDATLRALHAQPGFRRDGAGLLIVMLGVGDDDSAADAARLAAELRAAAPGYGTFVLISTPSDPVGPRLDALARAMPARAIPWAFRDLDGLASYAPYDPFWSGAQISDPCTEAIVDDATCAFSDVTADDERVLSACADDPTPPCWRLAADPMNCPNADHRHLEIDRVDYPPPGTHVRGQCVVP